MVDLPLCRDLIPGWRPSPSRKDGRPRKVNLYATTCTVCGDELGAGEAHVGSIDKGTGRINWICGTARWDRP